MPGNTQETPGKHPGKVHLLMFCIKGAGLEKKTSLGKVVVIFNKAKEKKNVPENSRETPGKHLGKVHLLMFFIKEAGLEKKNFFSESSNAVGIW